MKFNGATFNKAQQDQLKKKVGAELDELSSRMLNYTGDWVTGNEYHENDVVTWEHDGHLYEVIKAHTSSSTIGPSNTEYYKAMTASEPIKYELDLSTSEGRNTLVSISQAAKQGKRVVLIDSEDYIYSINKVTNYTVYFECLTVNTIGVDFIATEIYATNVIVNSSVAKRVALSIKNDGTFGNWGTDLGNVTVFIGA